MSETPTVDQLLNRLELRVIDNELQLVYYDPNVGTNYGSWGQSCYRVLSSVSLDQLK